MVMVVVAPGVDVVVDVELDPGSNVVDVVVPEASANWMSSKWTTLAAAAVSTWKLAVRRRLWIVESSSAVVLSVCQALSARIVAPNEKPAPREVTLLDPVQAGPV